MAEKNPAAWYSTTPEICIFRQECQEKKKQPANQEAKRQSQEKKILTLNLILKIRMHTAYIHNNNILRYNECSRVAILL